MTEKIIPQYLKWYWIIPKQTNVQTPALYRSGMFWVGSKSYQNPTILGIIPDPPQRPLANGYYWCGFGEGSQPTVLYHKNNRWYASGMTTLSNQIDYPLMVFNMVDGPDQGQVTREY